MHKFCYDCLIEWCRKHDTCPSCRQPLEFIGLDPNFDALIAETCTATGTEPPKARRSSDTSSEASDDSWDNENLKHDGPERVEKFTLSFEQGQIAGCSLAVRSGPGIRVASVHKGGAFYNVGLRPGDLVLEINGFPCNDIRVAIDVINNAQHGCKKLDLRAVSKSRSTKSRSSPTAHSAKKKLLDRPLRLLGMGGSREGAGDSDHEPWLVEA